MGKRYTEEELINAIKNNHTIADALREIGLSLSAGNYNTIHRKVKKYNLNTEHWHDGRCWKSTGRKHPLKIPTEKILVEDSTYNTTHLKKRLIEENLIEEICDDCDQLPDWRGKRLVLILDHINGVNDDHRIENLRLLCPNCNSQTETFSGKNIKIRRKKTLKEKACSVCESQISKYNKTGLCLTCANRKAVGRLNRPERNILLKEVEEIGYCATGRKYGVSDNAIRKWLK